MKRVLDRFSKMEKAAFSALKMGLEIVIACCIVLVLYINRANSFVQYSMLKDVVPSLAMSVLIVFGGGFAFDAAIKEASKK